MRKKNLVFFLIILIILCIQIALRLIFVFYGYISTEEGILITNQKLVYSGLVPFRDYNGWNSLLNDYLIGWFHFFIKPTILNQRLVGLILSVIVLYLTLLTTLFLKKKIFTLICAVILTFGAYPYVFYSNIPYAGLAMSLFIIVSLFLITVNLNKRKPSLRLSLMSIFFSALALMVYIQALVITLLILLYLLSIHKDKSARLLLILTAVMTSALVILFTLRDLEVLKYFLMIPLQVNNYLIYQQHNTDYSIAKIVNYFQVIFRDYGIFIISILAGFPVLAKKSKYFRFLLLLSVISLYIIFSGLLHKSAYPEYIYPLIPILALPASYFLTEFLTSLQYYWQKIVFSMAIILYLASNFINFSYYKLIKTSIKTINKTPYEYLESASQIVKQHSQPNDTILSFYSPLAIASERVQEPIFNMDRFSMTRASNKEAQRFHLVTNDMLNNYINSKKAQIIAFTDKNISQFGATEVERRNTLEFIKNNYSLISEYKDIDKIEDPKTEILYIYKKED